jgi:MoaA/NifB/PqqE/SkfB family radical SAM enzyme
MCDIWKETTNRELSADELTSHLGDIERLQVKWVVFSGGEPLMHSDLFRLAGMLRSRNIRVTVLSSGLLLKRYSKRIASDIDDIIVSLDGPPEIHDRVRGVPGAFAQLRQGVTEIHRDNRHLSIAARFTVQKKNHGAVQQTALLAHDLGFSSISFLAVDLSSKAFNRPDILDRACQTELALSQDELHTLESEFAGLQRQWRNSGFIREGVDKFDRILRHFRAHLGLCDSVAPSCNAPWVSAVIETDGTVRPCFFHPAIGSLRNQTLPQILNSFEAQAFRNSLDIASNPTCRRCVCSLHLS